MSVVAHPEELDSSSSSSGDEVDNVETYDHSTYAEDIPRTHTESSSYSKPLTSLFESMHCQIDDVATILGALRPYIVRLAHRDSDSDLPLEILKFIDDCIRSGNGCTKAQLYTIAAFHNGNSILLEDYDCQDKPGDDGCQENPKGKIIQQLNGVKSSIYEPPPTQCDVEYTAFMEELDKFDLIDKSM